VSHRDLLVRETGFLHDVRETGFLHDPSFSSFGPHFIYSENLDGLAHRTRTFFL